MIECSRGCAVSMGITSINLQDIVDEAKDYLDRWGVETKIEYRGSGAKADDFGQVLQLLNGIYGYAFVNITSRYDDRKYDVPRNRAMDCVESISTIFRRKSPEPVLS